MIQKFKSLTEGYVNGGTRTFYVRFFNEQEEKDFLIGLEGLQKRNPTLLSDCNDGCYKVSMEGLPFDCTHSVWDIMWHMCLGMANGMMDKASYKTYFPCVVSNEHIGPMTYFNPKVG